MDFPREMNDSGNSEKKRMKRELLLRLDRKISLVIRDDNHYLYSNYERYFGVWTPRYRGQMWQDLGGPSIMSLAAFR